MKFVKLYLESRKKSLFPEVTNWKHPNPKGIKGLKNVSKVKTIDWFFFHNTPYKIVVYGTPLIFGLNFGVLTIYFAIQQQLILGFISLFSFLMGMNELGKKVREKHIHNENTFYDEWMKEEK